MEENKFWITLWIGVIAAVTSIILMATVCGTYESIKMAELGYQKTAQVGTTGAYYQKAR